MNTNSRKMPPHWYKIYYGECPACGRPTIYRERNYTPRPPIKMDRYVQLSDKECYDWCIG